MREWRRKNPEYFKYLNQETAWSEKRRRYSKLWKDANKDYLKDYELKRKLQRREYMREYMRRYRTITT